MKNEQLLEKFEFVEQKLELDKSCHSKVYWWDLFRYTAYNDYVNRAIEVDSTVPSPVKIIGSFGRSLWDIAFLILKKPSLVLFSSHKRLDIRSSSVDPFTHFLNKDLELAKFSSVIVNRPNRNLTSPPKGAKSLASISILAQLLARLFGIFRSADRELTQKIDDLNALLKKPVLTEKTVCHGTAVFLITRAFYRALFRLSNTKVVVLTVSTGFEAVTDAANSLGIKVVEVQHGSPGRGKLNYDYSSGIQKTYTPSHFFATGAGFECEKYLPNRIERIINFGSPFLHAMGAATASIKEVYDFTFISQPDADLELSQALCKFLLEEKDSGREPSVCVRLHPAYSFSSERAPENFNLLGVTVIKSDEESIYVTLAKSRSVVGSYSTALFEALYFSKPVYTISSHSNLISKKMTISGWWTDWSDRGIRSSKVTDDYPEFYASYDSNNRIFRELLEL